MSFAEIVRADVRLAVLQLLAGDQGYSHNHEILRRAIDAATAITLSESEVKEHLSWLEDRRLIKTEHLDGGLVKATLTRDGKKVAEGTEFVAGVARPQPAD